MRRIARRGVGSTVMEIFFTLNYQASYRALRRAINEYYSGGGGYEGTAPRETVLRTTLSRLKRCGLLANSSGTWRATARGKEFIKKILDWKQREKLAEQPKNLIVAFDIPEKYSRQRYWLRLELKSLGFVMLQKSVWFGPGPLPKDFIRWLDGSRILQYMKFFRAKPEEIV